MTSHPQPEEGRAVGQVLRPLRDIASWVLVAAPAVMIFVAIIRLISLGDGDTFATRTQFSFDYFINEATVFLPLAGVLLAHLVQPRHPQAKLVLLVALGVYAAAAFFGVIFGFLIGLVNIASFNGRIAVEQLLLRAAWLAVFGVAAWALFALWRGLYSVPKPAAQPGVYGQPQYGAGAPTVGYPAPEYGQQQPAPGFGQPQPAPGQQPTWNQQAPIYGQPPVGGQPPADRTQVFGQQQSSPPGWSTPTPSPYGAPPPAAESSNPVPGFEPTSAPPAGQYNPTSAPPSGQYNPTSAPPSGQYNPTSAPPSGQYNPTSAPPAGQYQQPSPFNGFQSSGPPATGDDRTQVVRDEQRPGYGPADHDPPRG